MPQSTSKRSSPQDERRHALIMPREHGAWGILLVPLLTGAAVGVLRGGHAFPALLFTVAVIALFWLRTPFESWLGTGRVHAQNPEERHLVRGAILPLATIALAALAPLFWKASHLKLLWFGLATACAFAAQLLLTKLGRSTRMAAQVVGALGLTSTAPAAYYLVTGRLDRAAWALWLANWLFAGDQIHFVALRIHAARAAGWPEKFAAGWRFLLGQIVLVIILGITSYYGFISAWTLIAFVPVLVRGSIWFLTKPQPIIVRRLGWTELVHALVFGILLVGSFQVTL